MNQYGDPVTYGKHGGIDYNLIPGTPVIAAVDGEVIGVGMGTKEAWAGGMIVRVMNEHFITYYSHLIEAYVSPFQQIKRGDLIGLSGSSNQGRSHLHFGVLKFGGMSWKYSDSYDPNKFWLGGHPQCFDPNKDYSQYSSKELTRPVACKEYKKILLQFLPEKEEE
jgi:murein DD-endopeptidase MepM/ murein hydrolase activator NlpD